jgi:hypothetical protein
MIRSVNVERIGLHRVDLENFILFVEGKESYFGSDITGQRFGQERAGIASSVPGIIGSNTTFYGSGECHGRVPLACQ